MRSIKTTVTAAEEQNLTAVWDAMELCKGMHEHHRHPHGAMHTGVGGASRDVNGGELAGGVGVLGAVGAGALVLRRRRAGAGSGTGAGAGSKS